MKKDEVEKRREELIDRDYERALVNLGNAEEDLNEIDEELLREFADYLLELKGKEGEFKNIDEKADYITDNLNNALKAIENLKINIEALRKTGKTVSAILNGINGVNE